MFALRGALNGLCELASKAGNFVGELVRAVPFLEPFAAFPLNVGPKV
jgi:hypothetical protein